jgi:4-methyl-5(b-hydroxyethyl)-thiazole monophosphate biosynthesis
MKTAIVLLAPGFEEIEAVTIIDLLRRADIEVTTASVTEKSVTGSHDITILADALIGACSQKEYDIVVLPGGLPGTTNLKESKSVIDLLQSQSEKNKLVGAICAAPTVFETAGLITGKKVTSHPSEKAAFVNSDYKTDNIVLDGNIITSRAVGTAIEFSLFIIKLLISEEKANEIASKILFK